MKPSEEIKKIAIVHEIPISKLSGLEKIDKDFKKYGGAIKFESGINGFKEKYLLFIQDAVSYNSMTAVYHEAWS